MSGHSNRFVIPCCLCGEPVERSYDIKKTTCHKCRMKKNREATREYYRKRAIRKMIMEDEVLPVKEESVETPAVDETVLDEEAINVPVLESDVPTEQEA